MAPAAVVDGAVVVACPDEGSGASVVVGVAAGAVLVVSVALVGSAGAVGPVDGSGGLVVVGVAAGAVLVVSVVLVGSAGAVDPGAGSGAVVDVGGPTGAVLVVSVVLVGSAGAVDPVAGSEAVVDVGALTSAKTLFWVCAAEEFDVCEELGTEVALGDAATVKTVAHRLPAPHASPCRAALVVSFAPSGVASATVTRKEVVTDPAVPTSASSGTSQVTVLAR